MTAPKLTERVVAGLLRDRHTATGNGGSGEHAFLVQVRNAAGFDANRSFDAVAMNLWPSRGLTIEVFEIKVSRSDWLRELKKPDKAEDACQVADRFTIVAPAGCVKDDELPPTWGLIEVHGDGTDAKPWKLRSKTTGPLLRDDTRSALLPRGLVVGMLRSAPGAVPGGKNPSAADRDIAAARSEGWTAGHEAGKRQGARDAEQIRGDWERDAGRWRALQAALTERGVGRHEADGILRRADQIAAAVNGAATDRDLGALAGHLERVAADLRDRAEARGAGL